MQATLEQLVETRSQRAMGLMEYFQAVIAAPDRPAALPAYLGGLTPTVLYVEPDVLKRERLPEPAASPHAPTGERAESERLASERERPAGPPVAPEASDVGEDALYGERERETERRVAWAEERRELGRAAAGRAVVLGPPGQGKSLLTQMTARALAQQAWEGLDTQGVGVDNLPLPIVVPLNALATGGGQPGAAPEEVLRRALAATLREQGCPEGAVSYLVAHAHEPRSWLFLDALDEVSEPDRSGLPALFSALTAWNSRVIITSRPYGYTDRSLPFALTEYRLAPFSADQARTFVHQRFDGGPGHARLAPLLTSSPAVQQVSQNPFLLTLLCWVGERHDLPVDIRRTQIYDRVVRDVLGLQETGTGEVDEQRAEEVLPLLSEIAFTWFQDNAGREPMATKRLVDLIAASENRPVLLGLTPQETANLTARQQASWLPDEFRQKRFLVPLTVSRAAYVVPHRSFLEFLTACALADQLAPPQGPPAAAAPTAAEAWKFVDKKAWDPDWQEVIVFLAGKLADPIPLLKMLSNPRRTRANPYGDDVFRHRLALAALCLPEVDPALRARHSILIDRVTSDAVSLWLKGISSRRYDALIHISRVLPALGLANGRMNRIPLLEWLAHRLLGRSPHVRRAAACTVGHLGPATTVPEFLTRLAGLLGDPDRDVREAAADAIRHLGPAAVTPAIRRRLPDLLRDPEGTVRLSAVWAVRELGLLTANGDILTRVPDLLRDPDWAVQRAAAEALGRPDPFSPPGRRASISPWELDWLARQLRRRDPSYRKMAANQIFELGPPAATCTIRAALQRSLRDSDPGVRGAAAFALGRLGPAAPEVLTRLGDLLRDPNGIVFNNAALAVAALGPPAAIPAVLVGLAGILRDPKSGRRWLATYVLSRMMAQGARIFQAGSGCWEARTVAELSQV